jgi:hypothetical protein
MALSHPASTSTIATQLNEPNTKNHHRISTIVPNQNASTS